MICKSCKKSISSDEEYCPICGRKTHTNSSVAVVILLIVSIIVLVYIVFIPKTFMLPSFVNNSEHDFTLLTSNMTTDGYSKYVEGKIKNDSGKEYGYVQVEINLYKGYDLIDSTLDNINNLAPGQEWSFKAVIIDNSVTRYEIKKITGW